MSLVPEVTVGDLGALNLLGVGGQAKVYAAPDLSLPDETGPFVYKEYKARVIANRKSAVQSGLRALVRARLEAEAVSRATIDRRSVWPLAVVTDGNGATGLIMRRLPKRYFRTITFSTGGIKAIDLKCEMYLQEDGEVAARGLTPLTDTGRLYLYFRILEFLSTQHLTGVVVGDFSAANVFIAVNPGDQKQNLPMFIDTDSFRVETNVSPLPQPDTPGWEPPEHLRWKIRLDKLRATGGDIHQIEDARSRMHVQNRASDVYKAGLLGLRLFHDGESRLSVRRSDAAQARLGGLIGLDRTRQLFASLLEDPNDRPTMVDMHNVFRRH